MGMICLPEVLHFCMAQSKPLPRRVAVTHGMAWTLNIGTASLSHLPAVTGEEAGEEAEAGVGAGAEPCL